jgi:HSP20 family molecular chaperone IbpA
MTKPIDNQVMRADATDNVVRPAVDVFEDGNGITVQADLPGVNSDRLNVHVENAVLTIEGTALLDHAEQIDALYAELQAPVFQRSFTLSSELDVDRIAAQLSNGVLTVTIPKRETAKPRRIDVRAA